MTSALHEAVSDDENVVPVTSALMFTQSPDCTAPLHFSPLCRILFSRAAFGPEHDWFLCAVLLSEGFAAGICLTNCSRGGVPEWLWPAEQPAAAVTAVTALPSPAGAVSQLMALRSDPSSSARLQTSLNNLEIVLWNN